jgi:hypothetical protein
MKEINIEMDPPEQGCEDVDWNPLAHIRVQR